MIKLTDKETGARLGFITEEQLAALVDALEEEFEEDRDYYISRVTLEAFETEGVDPELVEILRLALGDREDMEILWSRD